MSSDTLVLVALALRNILITEGRFEELPKLSSDESLRIPFIHSFPQNCCEHSSYLLAMLLWSLGDRNDIYVVEGECRGESHYWVEVNGDVFDITIDQFNGFSDVVLAVESMELPCLREREKYVVPECFHSWDQNPKYEWLDFLKRKFDAYS